MVKELKLLLSILLTALILQVAAMPARAIGVGSFDISRADSDHNDQPTDVSLHLKLKNGARYIGKLYLTNLSNNETSLFLYAADALPARNGGLALRGRTDKKTGLAKWIKFSAAEINLAAHERKVIAYRINIPAFSPADEYMGGIVAESTKPIKNKNNKQFTINVLQRAALIVTQRMPGRPSIQKLLFLSFTKNWVDGKLKFDLILKNAGNVHLDPDAKVRISDFLGNQAGYLKVPSLGTIFPRKTARLSVLWDDPPLIGLFNAHAKASYGNGKSVEEKIRFFVLPWWLLIVAVIVILLIIWSIWRSRRVKQDKLRAIHAPEAGFSDLPEDF